MPKFILSLLPHTAVFWFLNLYSGWFLPQHYVYFIPTYSLTHTNREQKYLFPYITESETQVICSGKSKIYKINPNWQKASHYTHKNQTLHIWIKTCLHLCTHAYKHTAIFPWDCYKYSPALILWGWGCLQTPS